ncbi:PP2C family protein-serine/threonine phosphatase [Dactylosporangium sp. CA-092794]|uniref:PP2C family protein-serine/threonine phosphatase n=1 Tax=Dactylosporangium sp. CA-092794 TaxID=3239929 RepID=UPI003D8B93C8
MAMAVREQVNGVRVGVRYAVADHAGELGGDWYLCTPLPGGDVMLAVGDVMGHGRPAATTMVQLRAAMTRLALAGDDPGTILAALNRMLCRRPVTTLATAVCGRFRPADHSLTWSRAGHLPILRATHGRVNVLAQPSGMALGVDPGARYASARIVVEAGDLLLMYTDGVVEQRDRAIDQGVQGLVDDVRLALRVSAPGERLRTALDYAHRRNPDDDACLLAAEPV